MNDFQQKKRSIEILPATTAARTRVYRQDSPSSFPYEIVDEGRGSRVTGQERTGAGEEIGGYSLGKERERERGR